MPTPLHTLPAERQPLRGSTYEALSHRLAAVAADFERIGHPDLARDTEAVAAALVRLWLNTCETRAAGRAGD